MGDKIINKEKKAEHKREIDRKYYQKKKQEKLNKMGFMKKTFEFLEELKNGKKVDANVVNKIETEAKTLDEAFRLDYNKIKLENDNMLSKHQDLVSKFNEKLQSILDKAEEEKLKPIRKVSYFVIKAKKEDTKKIDESHDKWMEQTKIEFPEAKITLSLCQDVMIRNEKGQFEVVKDKE